MEQKHMGLFRLPKAVLAFVLAGALAVSGVCAGLSGAETGGVEAEQSSNLTVLDESTTWKYLDTNTDPAGDSTAADYNRTSWTAADYDDSAWTSASGTFGAKKGAIASLGEDFTPTVLLTQYQDDGTDIPAYFFRTSFECTAEQLADVTGVAGTIYYDDAATVYINGVKVAGFDDSSITENMAYGGSNASEPQAGAISLTDVSMLRAGTNVVAVELHQGRSSSSDIWMSFPELTLVSEPTASFALKDLVVNIGADESQLNLVWYNKTTTADTLVFGDTTYTASTQAASRSGYTINRVTVDGLASNTTYSYTIQNGEDKSATYTYTTGDLGTGSEVNVLIAGDPQIGCSNNETDAEGWRNTLSTALSDGTDYDFLFSMGDQVNAYYDSNNGDAVEEQYDGYLSSDLLSGLPMATIVGNHDAGRSNSTLYTEHFNMPNTTSYGQNQDGDGDYYFTYNGVLFMVLNSSNLSIADHKAFLEETLKNNSDCTWTVVGFHKSVYSVASHVTESDIETLRTGLSPILRELDIDLVVQGHDHVYARSYVMGGDDGMTAQVTDSDTSVGESDLYDPDGVVYVTFNSASGSKYYNTTQEAFTYTDVQNQEKTPNYSCLTVNGGELSVTTYRSSDKSVVDSFTIHKTIEAESVEIDASAVPETVYPGDSFILGVNFTPADTNATTLTWASSNAEIATVDENGLVTALGAGTAEITATTSNGLTASYTLSVSAKETAGTADTTSDDNTTSTASETPVADSTVPTTGDTADLALWILLGGAALAGLGACGAAVYRRRKA